MSGYTFLWDLDGVMIPGRGTTHLANGYNGDVEYFRKKFLAECEQEGTPLYSIKRENLEAGFEKWKEEYNNGEPISTVGQLASCLTDLRHKLKVFPGSAQTIYTKNAILEGLSLSRIREIAEELPYNPGLEDVRKALRYPPFTLQYLFSNSNKVLVDAVAKKFNFTYSEGALPEVILPDGSKTPYERHFLGRDDIKLSGRMLSGYNKSFNVFSYFENFPYDAFHCTLIAIDDNEIKMLESLREKGAFVFGFHNENDRDMKESDKKKMKEEDIIIIQDDLSKLTNYLHKIKDYEHSFYFGD